MTALCFVDANVFVYMADPRDARKQARAEEWVRRLWRERNGRTSIQALSEFYNTATRKLVPRVPPEQAWAYVQELMAWSPLAVDRSLVARARDVEQRYEISWWDSMIVAAAQAQECAILLTEDLHDGAAFGTVRVRNPFNHEAHEAEAAYEAAPSAAPLHRPRGRPRRRTVPVVSRT
jgi:predicted nucleic acid-binding protein